MLEIDFCPSPIGSSIFFIVHNEKVLNALLISSLLLKSQATQFSFQEANKKLIFFSISELFSSQVEWLEERKCLFLLERNSSPLVCVCAFILIQWHYYYLYLKSY